MSRDLAPGRRAPAAESAGLRTLEPDRCWQLLGRHRTGRLAVVTERGVDIFPVNYLVHDGAILLRSGPGTKMRELSRHPGVAFEVDGRGRGTAWSVVLHGTATRMSVDDDIVSSGVRNLRAVHPGGKFNYVRITPDDISGRAFPAASASAGAILVAVLLGVSVTALIGLSLVLGR